MKEGRNEGRKEGRKDGRKEGMKEGRKEGRKEGMKDGMKPRAFITRGLCQGQNTAFILRGGQKRKWQNWSTWR
jgi:flagellar biosynthesis/type III secretory pathway protein FliH